MVAPSHLKSFQALELAIRTGSLKAAADVLSITPAAVGQRVKALEEYLGLDLLTRGRSGLKPTETLSAAMPHLNAAFHALDAAAAQLDLQRGHEIHVAAVSDFADLWLARRIRSYKVSRPNIMFCVNGEGDVPMRMGTVDCEISFGPRREGSDVLFRDYVVPIGSPENMARIARLSKRERLEGFPLLHLDFYKDDPKAPDWPEWIAANKFHRTAPERGMRFRRITQVLETVLANAGLALCGLALTADLFDERRILPIFGLSSGTWTDHAFQARFRAEALARPQVRRFRDWLLAEAARTNAWLARKVKQAKPS